MRNRIFVTAGKSFEKGLAAYEEGNFHQAVKKFTKAIELEPNYAEAYLYRGKAKSELHKFTEAIEDYDIAIKIYAETIKDDKDDNKNHAYAEAYCHRGIANMMCYRFD